MSVEIKSGPAALADFVVKGAPPAAARQRAAMAICDTAGVILAGAVEPAARMVQEIVNEDGRGECRILGTREVAGPGGAALANGVAAHALDYDDMCFVSLAHPSCALVPAILTAAEIARAPGAVLSEAYVIGFELECRLGTTMNPRHYHERGWHCTSSIGTLGAAAAAARVLGLDRHAVRNALGIAASAACGLKENIGSMVKPLHAGMAARNGVMAARLAQRGFVSSPNALDGPQGYLAAMDSQHASIEPAVADLGMRWEILETGVTVKLYPSCAATHPPLDALLELRREASFTHEQVAAIDVEVDSMTPRLLIHDRPTTGLEAKFSMPFCAGAAVVYGRLGIDTFSADTIREPAIQALLPRVSLRANPAFDAAAPLSQAHVTVTLRDGRVLSRSADGARGYPGRLSTDELATKFAACASRALTGTAATSAWAGLQRIESFADVRELTALLTPGH
ncbi:MAG: MmgE/PrpD family protein [Acidobacteria bacterium]|nr:MAG: MmgE/PrpD family protein [Acidobacteriota bacterium]